MAEPWNQLVAIGEKCRKYFRFLRLFFADLRLLLRSFLRRVPFGEASLRHWDVFAVPTPPTFFVFI